MGLTTAFDRLRGRARRGFGKATLEDSSALAPEEDVSEEPHTQDDHEPAAAEEQHERLWSDPEDGSDEETSLQKVILADTDLPRTSGPPETTDEFPATLTTTPEDNDPPLASQVAEDETQPKAFVSDPEDTEMQEMQEEGAEKPATRNDSDHEEETMGEDEPDTENPNTVPETQDPAENPSIQEKELSEDDVSVPPLKSQRKKKTNQKSTNNLDLEDVLASTEHWFEQVSDKQSVTVKDIVKSLCVEYDCAKLPTTMKRAVREKLFELMKEEANEADDENEDEEPFGDKDDSSAEEGDSESSDDASTDRRSKVKKRKKDIVKPSKMSTKLAKKVHAQQLKKRQLEAERVKNEELNALQSKQDEAVAEAIATALDIDQDTLPQRLELLSKLDAKRLECFREMEPSVPPPAKQEPTVASPVAKAALAEDDSSSSEEDMELEIEGPRQSLGLKLVAPLRSPPKPKAKPAKNDRAALRARLVQQRRTMGNQWLARELGYKDEQEHLLDCRAAEAEKRKRIQQMEEAKANLRARQRERLLQGLQDENEEEVRGEDNLDGNEDDNGSQSSLGDEEDEELALAKEIEDNNGSQVMGHVDATLESYPENDGRPETQMDDATPMRDSKNSTEELRNEKHDEEEADARERNTPTDEGESPQAPNEDEPDNVDDYKPETQMDDSLAAFSDTVDNVSDKKYDESAAIDKSGVSDDVVGLHEFADTEGDVDDNKEGKGEPIPAKPPKRKGEKNLAWKAILEKDKLAAKKKKNSSLVEEEADEEEEEEVAGLEDFGFVVKKKKVEGEIEPDGEFDDDDLKDVVDELSDNEGDEDAGEKARKVMEKKEEKLRHKEIMRRMREGYDGRRGGIAVGGASRGLHRFEDLVAADNREDAKRLGLLNDDEIDSEDEEKGQGSQAKDDEEEDEAAFLDKIIKDRFLHRSSIQENFDEDDVEEETGSKLDSEDVAKERTQEELEELEQEKLAKRFSKRARMTRLVESHGDREEFSKSRLIDEDQSIMADLQAMKNGLVRKRTSSSQSSGSSAFGHLTTSIISTGGNLGAELSKSRRTKYARRSLSGGVTSSTSIKSISFSHVVFQSSNSRSGVSNSGSNADQKSSSRQPPMPKGKSFFERTVLSTLPSKKRKA